MEMNGSPQQSHEMMFERIVARDVDELYCPLCGRRIQVQWPPDFRKTVLDVGDENVIHTTLKRGYRIRLKHTLKQSTLKRPSPSIHAF